MTDEKSSRSHEDRAHRSSRDPKALAPRDGEEVKRRVKDTARVVGDGAGKAYDSVADCFGGERELNRTFADRSFLANVEITNRPSKFLFFLVVLALVQSLVPIFQWPLDLAARLLGFLFLYNSGLDELRIGFESSRRAGKIKSLLTCFLVLSSLQLIPNVLLDTHYHFGALWAFLLPVVLFITPWTEAPEQTVASLVCDTFFAPGSAILSGIIPDGLQAENGQNMAILFGVGVAALFWIGYLGSTAAYVTVWAFLALSTINSLGRPFIRKEDSSSGFYTQMTIWHNLLAIWLWRYLISAIEGISIPGLVSVIGIIQYHLPSYFLWVIGFMFAMLMTKKTEKRRRADTWYARWLMGVSRAADKAGESTSRSGSETHRSTQRPSSGDGKHRSSRPKKDERDRR
ncbi:hypothetical protein IAU60_000240 [Kwoniella sp. DSM 27419]